jgi:phenylacetic acid degradation operon negative regulatory protein
MMTITQGTTPAPAAVRLLAARGPSRKPQWLVMCFAGTHMLRQPQMAIGLQDLVTVLESLNIKEQTARSTVARLVARGILERRASGKRRYLAMTPYGRAVLQNGDRRVRRGTLVSIDGSIGRKWSGYWTTVNFSLPQARRRDRLVLTSRLTWLGFGRIQDGVWISPEEVDTDVLLRDLDIHENICVFRSTLEAGVDPAVMVRRAWDLSLIGQRYRSFIKRWEAFDGSGLDPVAGHLAMLADWLFAVREDPRLPIEYLPHDWPAVRAQELFGSLLTISGPPAHETATCRLTWREYSVNE